MQNCLRDALIFELMEVLPQLSSTEVHRRHSRWSNIFWLSWLHCKFGLLRVRSVSSNESFIWGPHAFGQKRRASTKQSTALYSERLEFLSFSSHCCNGHWKQLIQPGRRELLLQVWMSSCWNARPNVGTTPRFVNVNSWNLLCSPPVRNLSAFLYARHLHNVCENFSSSDAASN